MSTNLYPTGVRLMDAADVLTMDAVKAPRTINVTAGTLSVGDITGGANVTLISSIAMLGGSLIMSNATPGTQTTRTALQMYGEDPCAALGWGYRLRICNSGAGTLTLAGGTGVTVIGTATVATATYREFDVVYGGVLGAPTMTITNVGLGTYT